MDREQLSWDQLRTFEAVARFGSLTGAARALGISQSTVSRHVSRLEELAGSPLLVRESPIELTDRGAALLEATRPMLDAALAARSALEAEPELHGLVTLTTVGEVVRWTLIEQLPAFFADNPWLRLRILADNQVASLAAGEADVALRFFRPDQGDLYARKLLTEHYALFISEELERSEQTPWLGLTGSLAHIPEQRYAEQAFASRAPRLLLEDVESLGLAVERGLGVAVLPRGFASRLCGIVEVSPAEVGAAELGPMQPRDLWLVVHRSRRQLPKVRAVIGWVLEVLGG